MFFFYNRESSVTDVSNKIINKMTKLIKEINPKNDDIEKHATRTHQIIKNANICGCCDKCHKIFTDNTGEYFEFKVKPVDKLSEIFPNGLGMFNIQCCSSCLEECLKICPELSGATIVEVSGKDALPPSFENILNICSFTIRHPWTMFSSALITLKYIIDLKLKDTSELTWLERRFLNNLDTYQII